MKQCYIFFICFICLCNAKAQIVYHNLNPDVVFPPYANPLPSYSYSIDVDSDGNDDFKFRQYHDPASPPGYLSHDIIPLNGNKIISGATAYADTLNYGDSIKINSNYTGSLANIFYQYSTTTISGSWHNIKNHFIGVSFNSSSGLKYGWIRLRDERTIADCAYNSIAGQALRAGEGLPLSAGNVQLSDIANFGNGQDLNVKFSKAFSESTISGYRVLILPSTRISTFGADSAKQVPNSNTLFIPAQNADIDIVLNASGTDVYGTQITSLIAYNAYVLTYPDLVNNFDTLISAVSNKVILQKPNLPANGISVTPTKIPGGAYNLNVQFNPPSSEADIYNYRLFFIQEKDSTSFTIDTANLVLPANYSIINKTGAAQNLSYQSNLVKTNKGNILRPFEKYRAVLMSVTDTVNSNTSALSYSSNSFTVYTQVSAVNHIILSDVADSHVISDINVFFERVADESNISAYRGLIVPENSMTNFNLDSANASTSYMSFVPNGQDQHMQLPVGLKDIHGNTVVESQLYHFFVLTLNDNNLSDVNALSSVSKYFEYTTPNCLYAGLQDTLVTKYYNINDTTIKGEKYLPASHYRMDLNNDGSNDLDFQAYYVGSPAGFQYNIDVTPSNQVEISFTVPTSTIALAHDSADMICNELNWRSVQGMMKYEYSVGVQPNANNQYGEWQFDSIRYLSVRLINADTVYAWIKTKVSRGVNAVLLTFYSYGLKKDTDTGITENPLDNSDLEVYPNPAVDHTKIVFHSLKSMVKTIELVDARGREVFLYNDINGNEYTINTSGLAKGIYGLRITTKEGNSKFHKLIVE